MIAGPSQCGKTTFTKLLLQYADVLFERPIRKIVYCYGQWQEYFQDMASQITFVERIPEDVPALFPMGCRPGILMLDDLMRNCSEDERILDLLTKVSHHCDVTCIYLTQNIFPMLITSLPLIIIGIHWVSEPWNNKLLQGTFLRMRKFSRCHLAAVWLSHVGFTSANTGYPTITYQHTACLTIFACGLRQQANP